MKKISQLVISAAVSIIFLPAMAQENKTMTKSNKAEIPKQFIGTWAENNENCNSVKNGEASGIFIENRMIDLGPEGSCNIRAVTKSEENKFSGNFLCSSEGVTNKATYSFELKGTEKMAILGWGDKPRNFNKCKK